MTTTITAAPVIWDARNYHDTPATLAAVFASAAALIRANGYTPYYAGARWDTKEPQSISSAIDAACITARPDVRDAEDLSEECHVRLAGVLYLTGQLISRIGITGDMADQLGAWESTPVRIYATTRHRPRTACDALALLDTAAAMLTAIPADGAQ